ncbi:MAG: fumarylacetoacetate hydrolase family protein [Myxococcales bacterium]|nr:fumarylacetoacetate hydrolase family protein [Myxococcota bacterium]MDW8282465.1 fumarylacetoacetate hydrolase family protein [Myxococcales bacterium]
MRLVTFQAESGPRHGVLSEDGERVIDLLAALRQHEARAGRATDEQSVGRRYGHDMIGLIERADEALPIVRALLAQEAGGELPGEAVRALSTVRLLAPIPRPVSMRDGYAFRQHVEAARRNRGLPMIPEFDQFPVFYYTNHLSVVGPGPVPVLPRHLDRLDFELEAAVVIGRRGRNLDVAAADAAIFGLMVMNDWSARGLQMEEMKLNLGPAKGKDFATSLGPYLVPREDLGPALRVTPRGTQFALGMRCEVNGTEVSRGRLDEMSWTFAEIIARASYGTTLYPGEVIGSGTVGTGCFLELNGARVDQGRWLQPGDRVVCEIEHLGRLENVVVLEEAV